MCFLSALLPIVFVSLDCYILSYSEYVELSDGHGIKRAYVHNVAIREWTLCHTDAPNAGGDVFRAVQNSVRLNDC